MAPLVMGVLNVTPDSFSDGGRFLQHRSAIAHGLAMRAQGAAWIDVGGESTRPGARPVAESEELARVLPVVEALAAEGLAVSIDTRKAAVARAAVGAGARMLNDVGACLGPVAAELGVAWVAVHVRGDPETMQDDPRYDDVVSEVRDALVARAEQAVAAGVREVWIDPGIGFGKTLDHNLELLAHLDAFVATGYPVAIGTSRKGLIGRLTALSDRCARSRRPALPALPVLPGEAAAAVEEAAAAVEERLEGSLATATWAMALGAGLVRAHDVGPTVHAALVVGGRIAA